MSKDVGKKAALLNVIQSSLKNILDMEYKTVNGDSVDWEMTCRILKSQVRLCLDFMNQILSPVDDKKLKKKNEVKKENAK